MLDGHSSLAGELQASRDLASKVNNKLNMIAHDFSPRAGKSLCSRSAYIYIYTGRTCLKVNKQVHNNNNSPKAKADAGSGEDSYILWTLIYIRTYT